MNLLADYGLFLLKLLTVLVVVLAAAGAVAGMAARARRRGALPDGGAEGRVRVRRFNEQLDKLSEALSVSALEPAARQEAAKARRARKKAEAKAAKASAKAARKRRGDGQTLVPETPRPRTFVLDFAGDVRASAVEGLRREITAVLTSATSEDEVVVRLDSGGGLVAPYGLGASQLERVRKARIPLTVAVDRVAASGGYMMASVGDRLVAAPFAILGSIGVVAQVPNFHRLLERFDIDFETLTAGKYKRTLTLFGENTEEGRAKFLEDITRIHQQFKAHVARHRPKLDVERVSTGEIWSGDDALELALADELLTSDEYLVRAAESREVLLVDWKRRRGLGERFSIGAAATFEGLVLRAADAAQRARFGG